MGVFNGHFNKAKGYRAWDDDGRYGSVNSIKYFDGKIYYGIKGEIIKLIGKKDTYDIFEIAQYFKIKYGAFQIPLSYFMCYIDTYYTGITEYVSQELEGYIYPPFDPREDNITLVIDTVYNTSLRKRFSQIITREAFNKKRMSEDKDYVTRHENPIIILGTKDGKTLNSIYPICGETTIPDLNYEFYYFYHHS